MGAKTHNPEKKGHPPIHDPGTYTQRERRGEGVGEEENGEGRAHLHRETAGKKQQRADVTPSDMVEKK